MAIQAQISSGLVFGGCQDLLTENAYGLNNLCFNQSITNPISKPQHHELLQIISAQFENQRIEIDHYINTQNERLRMAVQEQRRQQTALLIKRCESRIQCLLKQRDEEIWRAARRNAELEECVRKMEMERQTWQRFAQENEALAASLSGTIQRVRAAAAEEEDAASWCVEREGGESRKMVCRCCNSRKSSVIMLPCRHLCSCRDCDAFLDCCPLCNVAKKASLEALL
ncbi:BOI-related E3 ubiquitin-protein ligase 1-like [Salvia miltiorrhiza]|uniref:BOI-related E3 ubiquitin-protein ligase 1-like n=1 Tax=Salvia miltiorrhiza TaxID=226208 RepID=UPI0025ACBEEE|nr:BOI-related E3 ubiquitin-protein ligase 1-like [Salvia miltiorrhiza]